MKKIFLLTTEQVLELNKMVCSREKQKSHCFDAGKVDSALGAAFYPGSPPFQYGGIASISGALCYFLTKAHAFMDGNKRTAGIAAAVLMESNGYDLLI